MPLQNESPARLLTSSVAVDVEIGNLATEYVAAVEIALEGLQREADRNGAPLDLAAVELSSRRIGNQVIISAAARVQVTL